MSRLRVTVECSISDGVDLDGAAFKAAADDVTTAALVQIESLAADHAVQYSDAKARWAIDRDPPMVGAAAVIPARLVTNSSGDWVLEVAGVPLVGILHDEDCEDDPSVVIWRTDGEPAIGPLPLRDVDAAYICETPECPRIDTEPTESGERYCGDHMPPPLAPDPLCRYCLEPIRRIVVDRTGAKAWADWDGSVPCVGRSELGGHEPESDPA